MTRRDPAPQGSQGHRPPDWVPSGPACGYVGEGSGGAVGADRCFLGFLSTLSSRPHEPAGPGVAVLGVCGATPPLRGCHQEGLKG